MTEKLKKYEGEAGDKEKDFLEAFGKAKERDASQMASQAVDKVAQLIADDRSYMKKTPLLKELKALELPTSRELSIELEGRFSVHYRGLLPASGDKLTLFRSNEALSEDFIESIRQMKGVNSYLAVLGGPDKHISILTALMESNPSVTAQLFEINKAHIWHTLTVFSAYNKQFEGTARDSHLLNKSDVHGDQKHADITLSVKRIQDALGEVERDRYLIHMSNVIILPSIGFAVDWMSKYTGDAEEGFRRLLFSAYRAPDWGIMRRVNKGWGGFFLDSKRMLEEVASNPNIENGSYMVIAMPYSDNHRILKKEDDGLRVWYKERKDRTMDTYLKLLGVTD